MNKSRPHWPVLGIYHEHDRLEVVLNERSSNASLYHLQSTHEATTVFCFLVSLTKPIKIQCPFKLQHSSAMCISAAGVQIEHEV